MTVCPHCKSSNNNFYYCKGCGKRLTGISKPVSVPKADSPDFIEEAIDIIEKNFTSSGMTIRTRTNTKKIDLGEISKEEGILFIDGEQWKENTPKQQCSCFIGEIVSIYMISATITMAGYIAGANEIEMICQLFASVFLALSFVVWFIVPLLSGLTPISSVIYNSALFTLQDKSVKNKMKELMIIFLFSSIPYIFIFPGIYSALKAKLSKNYVPLPFLISETKYLKKIKG